MRRLGEKTVTDPRACQHHAKAQQRTKCDGVASKEGGAAAAGRTAYREEYRRDYGPDLDESLDGAETGCEVFAPARQAAPF
jgi:hypothetical protein